MYSTKVFVIVDSVEDFDELCVRYAGEDISLEILDDIEKLDEYSSPEIWDCRQISRDIQNMGYEIELTE